MASGGVCTHATAFDQKSMPVTQMTQAAHACAILQVPVNSASSTCLSSWQTCGCTVSLGPRHKSGLWLSKLRLNKLGPCCSCLGFRARYMGSLPWRLSKVEMVTEVLKEKKKRPPYKEDSPRGRPRHRLSHKHERGAPGCQSQRGFSCPQAKARPGFYRPDINLRKYL